MLWRTQKELVIILLMVRQLLRHIDDVSLLFSKKSLVVVLELARREQVVSCSHKNGWARPEIEKTFFYKQHTQRLSWRTAAAPPHAVVLQRYRVLKNVVRQGKRRVENCGQILFPAAGPAHPRLCCLCVVNLRSKSRP